ncbi:MAG: anion permease [Candidatus Anammoxibacter sp.]
MVILVILFIATCFLAYSNGANDNFKGVATLFGSKTINYKKAIHLATVTTFAGSLSSMFFAQVLVKAFSGKGLVPDNISMSPEFLTAVAIGAGITVIIATIVGFPISTTHSLVGSLLGAGFMAIGPLVNFHVLGKSFLLPLLISPLIATVFGGIVYTIFRSIRLRTGITKEWCVCVGGKKELQPVPLPISEFSTNCATPAMVAIGTDKDCIEMYKGNLLGINAQKLLDYLHFCSAGVVCFARGLNDTPKIVALLLIIKAFSIHWGMLAIAIGMAAGGLLNARKVADTMSNKITKLNHGQGFSANLVTSILVIFASKLGIPVSTTHVSVGAIFGIGIVSKKINTGVAFEILLSWIVTLPVSALLSGGAYWILTTMNS